MGWIWGVLKRVADNGERKGTYAEHVRRVCICIEAAFKISR